MKLWKCLCTALLPLAGLAHGNTVSEATFGPDGVPLEPDGKGFSIGSRMEALGATVLGDGTVDPTSRTAYLLVRTPTSNCQLVTIPLNRGAAPLEVTSRLDLPGVSADRFVMDASDGLRIFTADKIISVTRNGDTPTTATVQNIAALTGFKAAGYTASTGQLIRLGSVIDSHERAGDTFTFRGLSFATGDAYLNMNGGRFAIASGKQVNFFQWPAGATTSTPLGAGTFNDPIPTVASMAIMGPRIAVAGTNAFYVADPANLAVPPSVIRTDPNPKLIPFLGGLATDRLRFFNGNSNVNDYTIPAGYMPAPQLMAASAAGFDALLVPPAVGGVQSLYSITTRPSFEADCLEGVQLRITTPGLIISSAEFQSFKAGVHVKAFLYSTPPNWDYSMPLQLRAESDTIVTGEPGTLVSIPLGQGSDFNTDLVGLWSVAIQADQPGAIGQIPATGASWLGYRLPAPGGVAPASYLQSDLLHRSGGPAIRLRAESAVSVGAITFTGPWGPTPFAGTSIREMTLQIPGGFDTVEFAEDADFTSVVSRPRNETRDDYSYTLQSGAEGIHPLWLRAKRGRQVPVVKQLDVLLDSTPPGATGTPTDQGKWLYPNYLPAAQFDWSPTVDNPGGSGAVLYQYLLTVQPPPSPFGLREPVVFTGLVLAPHASVGLGASRGHATMKVRAVDRVGNWGPWSAPSDGLEILESRAPVLTAVSPTDQVVNQPRAAFDYTATADVATRIQMTEDPTFAAPQDESWYGGSRVYFNLPNLQNGRHVVYHRLVNPIGVSAVKETGVFLDTVAPVAEPPVPETSYAAQGSVGLTWRLPEDPAPASGTSSAQLRLVREPSGEPVTTSTLTLESEATITFSVTTGGRFHAELRGTDQAGNTGAWAASESFDLNTAPKIEALPPDYAILDRVRIRARWRTSDAEGNPVTVDVYLRRSDSDEPFLVATGLDARAGEYLFELTLTDPAAYRVLIEAHDDSGGHGTATSAPLQPYVVPGTGWIIE